MHKHEVVVVYVDVAFAPMLIN